MVSEFEEIDCPICGQKIKAKWGLLRNALRNHICIIHKKDFVYSGVIARQTIKQNLEKRGGLMADVTAGGSSRRMPLGNFSPRFSFSEKRGKEEIQLKEPRHREPRQPIFRPIINPSGGGRNPWGEFWKVIAIIVLVFFVGIFLINTINRGIPQKLTKEGYVLIQEQEFPKKFRFVDVWNTISGKGLDMQTWDSVVDESSLVEDAGIEISNFYSAQSYFLEDKPIRASGIVQVNNLNEMLDQEMAISCELEDYEGDITVIPEKIISQRQGISCVFNDGLPVDDPTTKVAKVKVAYAFSGYGSWPAYFIDQKSYFNCVADKINPMNSINDRYVSGDTVISRSSDGPVQVSINSETSQPFVEGDQFVLFHVQLRENAGWHGNIKEIKDLRLSVPEGIELGSDIRQCDFEATGEVDENNQRVYVLTLPGKLKANKECTAKEIILGGYYCNPDLIDLNCDFKVNEISGNFDDSCKPKFYAPFLVSADFIYETESTTTVDVRPGVSNPDGTDICSVYKTESECTRIGCEVVLDSLNNFKLCRDCQEYSCSNYNMQRCFLDPCHFGNCVFENNECKAQDNLA